MRKTPAPPAAPPPSAIVRRQPAHADSKGRQRLTADIPKELIVACKVRAAQTEQTLNAVVEAAIRQYLN